MVKDYLDFKLRLATTSCEHVFKSTNGVAVVILVAQKALLRPNPDVDVSSFELQDLSFFFSKVTEGRTASLEFSV